MLQCWSGYIMADLILALDVTDKKRAVTIAGMCSSHVDAIKIGYPLVLAAGLTIAHEIGKFNLPLIADFKVADIPHTNTLIAEQVFEAGFTAIICQGFVGSDAVKACVESAHSHGGECLVVTEMSHPGATEFFRGGTAERIARISVGCNADGIIAPATRPDRVRCLREIVGNRKILSPGVGVQGGELGEIAGIVDGVIIGRAIYTAEDPARAAREFSRNLQI